jgi:hypothetical protein
MEVLEVDDLDEGLISSAGSQKSSDRYGIGKPPLGRSEER